ncbi:Pleckstrin-likey-Like Domain Family B Member 2 [Manis pentadactyla]|nr:Pleckstrin-likey-Like Domain Family B Member 2 [Manis pentadactyla]
MLGLASRSSPAKEDLPPPCWEGPNPGPGPLAVRIQARKEEGPVRRVHAPRRGEEESRRPPGPPQSPAIPHREAARPGRASPRSSFQNLPGDP